jgi:hypothetical protein
MFCTSTIPNAFMARCIIQHRDSTFILSSINIKGDEMGGIYSIDGRMVYFIFRSLKLMYIIFKNYIPAQQKTLLLRYEDGQINLREAVAVY